MILGTQAQELKTETRNWATLPFPPPGHRSGSLAGALGFRTGDPHFGEVSSLDWYSCHHHCLSQGHQLLRVDLDRAAGCLECHVPGHQLCLVLDTLPIQLLIQE